MLTTYAVVTPARTFSSLVAGMMDRSGISMTLGQHQNTAAKANPHGFFEVMWALDLNDAILKELGTTVLGPAPGLDAVRGLLDSPLQARIFHHLQASAEMAAHIGLDAWGFKDNRVCLLAPLWHAPLLALRAHIITVDRPEEATVASMMQAWPDKFFWREDALAWHRTARERADAMIAGWPYPTHRVDGDALFQDTGREVARLSAFVGRPIDTSHLDPAGRHHTVLKSP